MTIFRFRSSAAVTFRALFWDQKSSEDRESLSAVLNLYDGVTTLVIWRNINHKASLCAKKVCLHFGALVSSHCKCKMHLIQTDFYDETWADLNSKVRANAITDSRNPRIKSFHSWNFSQRKCNTKCLLCRAAGTKKKSLHITPTCTKEISLLSETLSDTNTQKLNCCHTKTETVRKKVKERLRRIQLLNKCEMIYKRIKAEKCKRT